MRSFAASAIVILSISAFCSGQQPSASPNARPPEDAATFGNQRSPKKDKAATSKTVSGQVTDQTGNILNGAMVTLTDRKTNLKTSFFTKKDGRYQFADLNFNQDYELQARYKDKQSEPRKISQFDGSPRPVRILEVPVKTASASPATAKSPATKP